MTKRVPMLKFKPVTATIEAANGVRGLYSIFKDAAKKFRLEVNARVLATYGEGVEARAAADWYDAKGELP